ncbi:uncharacterized protein LOC127799454 isoform X2 [Diospyros lotus]|uniref:uncharacterized protein LOC127799454 isoform X2 n=1 Tax=Diospyros lotus TaxID=55363 RepID=UPI002256BF3C|nr:uncharacterized protein LOC127799454 isoform X2 [Diospyros lotus]XP_052189474.1 uncharacterized protein LOC127799454 isoform X2 [Diospyros lotus]
MTRFCTCTALASSVDLSEKRKQFHKITCKTCGRPLVYEIGPPSASMLSTVNPKSTNLINPELTWKTVPKGFRSERSRKQAWSLNVDVQHDCKSTKRDELSVSESEKLGVDVLGRHFSDEIKHVPYKKRRFMLQSPSPPSRSPSPHCEQSISSGPQTSSPQPEDFDWTADSKCASSQQFLSSSIFNREPGSFDGSIAVKSCQRSENTLANGAPSDVTDTKLCYIDDFSGIALLATAACNNSIIDDSQNPKDNQPVCEVLTSVGIDISERATPLERSMTSSEKGNLFLKNLAHEDNVDGSMLQNSSVAVPQNFHGMIDCETGKRSASIKDERLHWDLNTVMEAWELPHDNQNTCSTRNDLEHISDDDVHCVKSEKSEGCARRVGPDNAPELSTISTEATKVSTQVFVNDKTLDFSPCPVSNPISNSPLSRENIDASSKNVVSQTREDCSGTSSMQQLIQTATCTEDAHFGKHDVLLDLEITEKVDSIQQNTDSKEAFDLIDNGTSSTELASSITNVEYSVCKLGKGHPSYPSPECENIDMLDANLGLQPAVAVDVERKQHKVVPGAHATPRESSLHVDLNDPESFPSLGKVGVEVHSDDGYDSDVSPGDHGGTIGAKKMTGSKAGYESPFEDGELRESGLHSWEENEVEGEIERVDYDSDNRDEDDLDVAPQCMPDFGSESCENDNNGSLAETVVHSGRPNALKESSPSVSLNKISEQGKLPEGCECSTNRAGETNNKVLVSNSMRGLDIEGSSTGEVRSRETGEKLSSRIEGPSVSDGLQRKNRGSYDSYFQARKVSPSAKYLGRDRPARPMQNESQGDDQWIDSPTGYGDSRNNYQHGHSQGTGRFRPTRNSASSAMRIDGFAYCHRRSINHSLKGDFRPAIRRISGDGDAYNVRDTTSATDNSRIRRRDRYEIYQQGVNRGPRVEYRGPMFDDPASSSVHLSHDLARRERSVSPVLSRGASFSQYRWKSRSRSRTRSPLAWHIQRERNMGARRLSRSPDFRSDARMQRTRMPFQNSDFAEDGEDVFMSPSRIHYSPQRHSRWIDRNYIGPRFRQRKSPGRFLWRNPRFGSGGGSGRMMPDDRPRSTTRPGRFTELSAGTGRAHKYNGNDYERTKYSDKYEMIHQVKRSDTGGTLKRFRYDPEDCFEI